jgi:KipI family sensor histidine kinase inhibitor
MRIHSAGENALIVYLDEEASAAVSARVQAFAAALPGALGTALRDLIPSYASVLVVYDPALIRAPELIRRLRTLGAQLDAAPMPEAPLLELPAWYSPRAGADLEALAARARLSVDEVIRLHSDCEYRVHAIGFAPGFAYLGEVDARIAAPRLPTPRTGVPRGSIGIADRQTAVYPAPSPGGWNLIGRCPLPLFDPGATPCTPFSVGMRVRFRPIEEAEFVALGGVIGG